MSGITFVRGTAVTSNWLNAINDHVYDDVPASGSYTHDSSTLRFLSSATGAVARAVQAVFSDTTNAKNCGATGDGVTLDTVNIQKVIDEDLPADFGVLIFPPAHYKIGQIVFDGFSNLLIIASGCKFTLVGDNAGFLVKGTSSNIFVQGGSITGDGANRDADTSKAQIGWLFGNEAGANVQNVFVEDVIVDASNIGFKFAEGTGGGSGKTNNVKITRCQAKDIVGVVGGVGYGFQFTQAPYSLLSDCQAINCQRHGIYFAEGRDYTAVNCIIRDHRSTVFNASYRVAMSISRSRNVAVSNCVFDNCYDGTIEIDTDTAGTAPDNVSIGTTISNCAFYDSKLADIRIGTVPATDGLSYDVLVSNCVSVRGNNAQPSVLIEGGDRVKISNYTTRGSGLAGGRAITLAGTSGAAYTDNIEITGLQATNWDYGIQVESVLKTGTSKIRLLNNNISALTAELEFVGGEDSITNNNLIYTRSNGKNASRTYTSSGSNLTLPFGGVTNFTMSPSGASTFLNFSGGTEGQEVTLFFTNGNTTLLNTNFYLAGGVNFVGTASDTLTLVYQGGAWREKSRSVN